MNLRPSTENFKTTLLRLGGTLLTLALLVYLLSTQGWHEILGAIRQIPVWAFILALVFITISRFAVAGRWHLLLRAAGLKISAGQTIRLTFAGLFATNFLPTTIGGDVVRLAGTLKLQLDAAVCATSLVVDRLVGMAGMTMALPFLLLSSTSQAYWGELSHLTISPLLAGIFPLQIGEGLKKLWARGWHIFRRLLAASSLWLQKPRALLASLAMSWVHMLCLFSILTLFLDGMGETITFWQIAGLYSLVYLVTLLPISINGYGVQELSMTYMLSQFGGVSISNAITAALLFRTLMMVASLPGAAFIPGLLYNRAPAHKSG